MTRGECSGRSGHRRNPFTCSNHMHCCGRHMYTDPRSLTPHTMTATDLRHKFNDAHAHLMALPNACDVCHERFFGEQGLKELPKHDHAVHAAHRGKWVCRRCYDDSKRRLRLSRLNDMVPDLGDERPDELVGLTWAEQLLIARVARVVNVHVLGTGGQLGYSRHCVSFCQHTVELVSVLPLLPEQVDNIVVIRLRHELPDIIVQVRRHVVHRALVWLKTNCPYYHDITIDMERIQRLPEDGNVYVGRKPADAPADAVVLGRDVLHVVDDESPPRDDGTNVSGSSTHDGDGAGTHDVDEAGESANRTRAHTGATHTTSQTPPVPPRPPLPPTTAPGSVAAGTVNVDQIHTLSFDDDPDSSTFIPDWTDYDKLSAIQRRDVELLIETNIAKPAPHPGTVNVAATAPTIDHAGTTNSSSSAAPAGSSGTPATTPGAGGVKTKHGCVLSLTPHGRHATAIIPAPGLSEKLVCEDIDGWMTMAFPGLYGSGRADFSAQRDLAHGPTGTPGVYGATRKHRPYEVSLAEYAEHMARLEDPRFIRHVTWRYSMLNMIQRHALWSSASFFVHRNEYLSEWMDRDDLQQVAQHHPEVFENAFRYSKGVRGSRYYWKEAQQDLIAFVQQQGVPTFFMTLSFADFQLHDLGQYLLAKRGPDDLAADRLLGRGDGEPDRRALLKDQPDTCVLYFWTRVKAFIETVLVELLNVDDVFVRFEEQGERPVARPRSHACVRATTHVA